MKLLVIAFIACCISIGTKAQDCSGALIQGYRGDTSVTVDEAKRIILTSFAAINSCRQKLVLRSGSLYAYTANGDIVMVENFTSPLDSETKLRLIGKLIPGMKLMLDEMHYGEENRLAPKVTLTLVKGATYLSSR